MERGPIEEAVVIVKPGAGEAVVTSLRVKRQASGRRRPSVADRHDINDDLRYQRRCTTIDREQVQEQGD